MAASPALLQAVEALGPVRAILSPTKMHNLHLAAWLEAFAQADFFAAPGLARRRPDLPPAQPLSDAPPQAWAGALDQALFGPSRIADEVVLFHRASRTALVCDLLQQLPQDAFSGWRRAAARLDLMIGPRPRVPRKFRLALTDRARARAAARKILGWEAERVLIAHGEPVREGGDPCLRQAFAWLSP